MTITITIIITTDIVVLYQCVFSVWPYYKLLITHAALKAWSSVSTAGTSRCTRTHLKTNNKISGDVINASQASKRVTKMKMAVPLVLWGLIILMLSASHETDRFINPFCCPLYDPPPLFRSGLKSIYVHTYEHLSQVENMRERGKISRQTRNNDKT